MSHHRAFNSYEDRKKIAAAFAKSVGITVPQAIKILNEAEGIKGSDVKRIYSNSNLPEKTSQKFTYENHMEKVKAAVLRFSRYGNVKHNLGKVLDAALPEVCGESDVLSANTLDKKISLALCKGLESNIVNYLVRFHHFNPTEIYDISASGLESYSCIAFSTAHITYEDSLYLSERAKNNDDYTVAERKFGFFLKLTGYEDEGGYSSNLDQNFSQSLCNLITFAMTRGFLMIELDCDASTYEGFPTYEW